jgi:hypothetical protein
MADQTERITVFRSGDHNAEEDANAACERLMEQGIDAILVSDEDPDVIDGTWEVRVPLVDQEKAEAILATPVLEAEDEEEVSEEGLSHDLDFVSIFSSQGIEAEMEAISIQAVLEANGIPCTVVGSAQIPSLPFEVRVPKLRAGEALDLLKEVKEAGAAEAE